MSKDNVKNVISERIEQEREFIEKRQIDLIFTTSFEEGFNDSVLKTMDLISTASTLDDVKSVILEFVISTMKMVAAVQEAHDDHGNRLDFLEEWKSDVDHEEYARERNLRAEGGF